MSDTSQSPLNPNAFYVTHLGVLKIALPVTLAYLSTPILGLVDTAVIGRLGDATLIGGIAVATIIFEIFFNTLNFLRTGTTGLTAQAMGAGNDREVRANVLRALIIAAVAGLLIVLLQKPFLEVGLAVIGGSDDVQAAARRYFEVRIYSAPLLLANYAILGWLLGLGRAGTGLVLQLALNGINIVLSISFVIGLGYSVEGVALATVISEAVACVLGLGIVWHLGRSGTWPRMAEIFDKVQMKRMIAVNRDIMIRSFTLLFAFAFFTSRSAAQGDTILATNAILEKFLSVGAYFLDGLATAAEQLAGRAVGALHRPAFDRTVRLTVLWSFIMAAILTIIYAVFGEAFVHMMTIAEDIRETSQHYILWATLAPLIGVLAFQMDGIFIGATWSKDMRNMMLLSLVGYLAIYYGTFPFIGNHGLWLAFVAFLGLRGISLAFLCRRRRVTAFPTTH